MRAAITGATGHLGSHLASALRERGHEVLAIVRPRSDLWRLESIRGNISILKAELTNLPQAEVQAFRPDAMFHLAWSGVTADNRNLGDHALPNVDGSVHAFETARKAGCSAWIGVGSQAEYGIYDAALSETSPCEPISVYGAAKLAVSHLTRALSAVSGMRFVWFRLFATYGPMDDPRHLIPFVIDQFLADKSPSLTPGAQTWDYLYVHDAALALVEAGVNESLSGVFNLASGTPIVVRDLVRRIHDRIDPHCEIGLGTLSYSSQQIMSLRADVSKLYQSSHWRPETTLDSGLDKTIAWHRSRRKVSA